MKYLFLFSILILSSCKQKNSNSTELISTKTIKNNNNITIVFNQAPKVKFIPLVMGSKSDTILGGRPYLVNLASYRDSEGIVQKINAKRLPFNDTINISIKNKQLEIHFDQIALEGVSHLFRSGDSILVKYHDGKAYVKVINRKTKPFDYSFNDISSTKTNLTPFEAFFRYNALPLTNSKVKLAKYREEYYSVYLPQKATELQTYLSHQKKQLDSVYSKRLLSKSIYDYHHNKIKYTYYSMLAKLKQLDYPVLKENNPSSDDFKSNINKSFNIKDSKSITVETLIKSGDSLLSYKFYQDFLNYYFLPNYIENQTTKYSFKYKNFGGSNYDWGAVYDLIQNSQLFSDKIKKYQLYRYMSRISRDMPPKTIDEYYTKFKSIPKNSIYKDLINRDFQIDKSITHKLVLKDTLNQTYYLEDILEKNKGKLILVEFWASWCGPCIKLIPSANKLKKIYSEDIVFIAISVENDFNEWKSSNSIKQKSSLTQNYILRNPYTSKIIKENHVIYVPRFFLYNKSGQLIDSNTPSPEKNELIQLIDKHLK
jgi:thiol-disulfide isomerase/thioredoxin